MLEFCLENGGEMGLAPYPKHWSEGSPPIPKIIGYGHIVQTERLPDGRSNIILEGLGTGELIHIESSEPFYIGTLERRIHEKNPKTDPIFEEEVEELLHLTKRILLSEGAEESLILKMNQISTHPYPVDFISSILYFDFDTKQKILEETSIRTKAKIVKEILIQLNLTE